MKTPIIYSIAPIVIFALFPSLGFSDWLHWRGPNQNNSLQNDAISFPVSWSESENILWKTPLSDPGNSSPVATSDSVYITQSSDQGKTRSLLAFDLKSGIQLWSQDEAYAENEPTHKTNQWSSASPTLSGQFIFTWQGSAGMFTYDIESQKKLWQRELGTYSHQWGANAASPLIHGNKVILHTGPGSKSLLTALDKETGKPIWEKSLPTSEFKEFKGSWATPMIYENGSRTELIVPFANALHAFDPETGNEIWKCDGLGDLCYTDPIISNNHIVYMSGYGGPAICLKIPADDVSGNITDTHRLWISPPGGKGRKNPQRIGTGQIVGKHIYMVNEPGIAECIELETGRQLWKQRLTKRTWSGLSLINGLFYVIDQTATTYVFKATKEGLELLHTNRFSGNQVTNSTLVFTDGKILVRTHSNLYCIGM